MRPTPAAPKTATGGRASVWRHSFAAEGLGAGRRLGRGRFASSRNPARLFFGRRLLDRRRQARQLRVVVTFSPSAGLLLRCVAQCAAILGDSGPAPDCSFNTPLTSVTPNAAAATRAATAAIQIGFDSCGRHRDRPSGSSGTSGSFCNSPASATGMPTGNPWDTVAAAASSSSTRNNDTGAPNRKAGRVPLVFRPAAAPRATPDHHRRNHRPAGRRFHFIGHSLGLRGRGFPSLTGCQSSTLNARGRHVGRRKVGRQLHPARFHARRKEIGIDPGRLVRNVRRIARLGRSGTRSGRRSPLSAGRSAASSLDRSGTAGPAAGLVE